MRFKILSTGVFTDNIGREHNITEETLENISASFAANKEDVPIVVGHPKTNEPAYGWINKIEKIGKDLYAEAQQVLPAFLDAVKAGLYKNRSISFNKETHRPLHVGFLGAAAPAVPGLGDVQFTNNADDENIVNLSAEDAEPVQSDDSLPPITVEKTIPEAEFAALQKVCDDLKAENDNLNKQISVMLGDKRSAEFNAMIDGLITAGKVLPAERDSLTKLFATLDKASVEFSAEDENNPLRAFQESLQARPVMLSMKPIDAPIITPVEEKPVPGSAAAIKLAMQE